MLVGEGRAWQRGALAGGLSSLAQLTTNPALLPLGVSQADNPDGCQSLQSAELGCNTRRNPQFRNAVDTDRVVRRVCNACGQWLQRYHAKSNASATPAEKKRVPVGLPAALSSDSALHMGARRAPQRVRYSQR